MIKLCGEDIYISQKLLGDLFIGTANYSAIESEFNSYLYINGFISCLVASDKNRKSTSEYLDKIYCFDKRMENIYFDDEDFEMIGSNMYLNGMFQTCYTPFSRNTKVIELKQSDNAAVNNGKSKFTNQYIYPQVFSELIDVTDNVITPFNLSEEWYGSEHILYQDIFDSLREGNPSGAAGGFYFNYYNLKEIEKICELYDVELQYEFLSPEINDIQTLIKLKELVNKPSKNKSTSKTTPKINSQTYLNHGAFIYTLAKNNKNLLKKSGEINRSALCNLVIQEFENTQFTKDKTSLDRCLKSILSEIENYAGITAEKVKRTLS